MTLFPPADRRFLEAASRVAFSNPFLPDRIEFEREALGDEFQAGSSRVWSRRADVDEVQPNVKRLATRAAAIIDDARTQLADGKRGDAQELALYEDVALYLLYHRYRPQLQAALQPALDGGPPTKVAFWETVAKPQRIDRDMTGVFAYFIGPNFTKEGDHGWTGRVCGGRNRRNHAR